MSRPLGVPGALVAVLLARLAAPAVGEEPPASPAAPQAAMDRARQSYLDGETAYRLDKFEEAARLYEEAYRLSKLPAILFDLAQAHRRWYDRDPAADHLRRAADLYRSFLRDAPAAPQAPVAQRFIAEIERTLADEERKRREAVVGRASGREGIKLAEQLLAAGDAPTAAVALERVLAERGSPRNLTAEALEKRGLVAGVLGDARRARWCFERALELDPGWVPPPSAAPTAREEYGAAVRNAWGKPLELQHDAPGEVKRGEPALLAVRVLHDRVGLVERIAVFYRRQGEGAYVVSRVPTTPGQLVVELPARYLTGPPGTRYEYYLVALDRLDGELAFDGMPAQPFTVPIAEEPVVAKPRRRWPIALGVVLGVAAAGAGVATAVVLTRPQETTLPLWDLRP